MASMKQENVKYIPVDFFIRITRKDNEPNERAILVAKEKGGERCFTFIYYDQPFSENQVDLTVVDSDYSIKPL